MEEATVLNINTKQTNIEKEETLVIKDTEKIKLSQDTINDLSLKCPFCKSESIFLQIPEYNFIRLENENTNKIRGSNLSYYPILFCDNLHAFCSICHDYPHIGKNCDNEEETTLHNIMSILEILKNDVPDDKFDRFNYLKKKSLEKSSNSNTTITEENTIKEEYTSLFITEDEEFPIINSSLGYIKCPKCLKSDNNLDLIIPKYDFMQIEDIKTRQRICKPIHYFPIVFCDVCKFPFCAICSKECHLNRLCDNKNLDKVLNIQKQLDYLQINVPDSKQERFKELRVISYKHAIDYLEYKKNPNKLPKKKLKVIREENKQNTSSTCCMCCEDCCAKSACTFKCLGLYVLMMLLCIFYTPICFFILGFCVGIIFLILALKILAFLYYCIQYMCCVKEVKRETKGNVTTIYLDGDHIRRLESELSENCEFFSLCGQNCVGAIVVCALTPYYKIIEEFTRLL